ncbi:helix-turn-helix domain-containing protein [Pararhizobium haloflavum]|uniref:helix-turn-helix domain-containing protein n=1 Tax=Pararhizobium haloflavum TaxID=2037914 RepID=UPI0012FFEA8A|nr:helix-turn-helix domain-containing protein [Pararhizobium haloflavum]
MDDKLVPYPEFASRVNHACDNNPKIPDGWGRQAYVQAQFEKAGIPLSRQSVNRWFQGYSVPRLKKLNFLAKVLDVDEGWLVFGAMPEGEHHRKTRHPIDISGAIQLVTGLLTMDGAICAFAEPNDEAGLHFRTVYKGRHFRCHCVAADTTDEGYRVVVSPNYANLTTFIVVRYEGWDFRIFKIVPGVIKSTGEHRGGFVTLDFTISKEAVIVGGEEFPRIQSVSDLLV